MKSNEHMTSKRIDIDLLNDYQKMLKLGYGSKKIPASLALNHFQTVANDIYTYLIQPCIIAPRYKQEEQLNKETGELEWVEVPQDTRVCPYVYDVSADSKSDFLKNEPDIFKFYDYICNLSAEVLSTDDTFRYARNAIEKFPFPKVQSYSMSSVTEEEILSAEGISSCWSPVLLDDKNAELYQSLWNSMFKAFTLPSLFENDEWKVSSPVINNTDNNFNSLLNLPWTDLSAYHVSSDMNRQYYDWQMYKGTQYPVTRYCQTYDKIMMSDNLNRTQDEKVYLWEKEHMSTPYFGFWKPIADFIGNSLPGFPIMRESMGEILTYKNQFVQNNDDQFIVGGKNTISVGLDDYGWNHSRPPDYGYDLSSWSWLSKPLRTTNTQYGMIEYGQGSYLTFHYDSSRYDERFGNPKIMPPKKVVVQNLFALAYYWTKWLSQMKEDYVADLGNYVTTAVAQQHIPYRQLDKHDSLLIGWTMHPIISSDGTEENLIGIIECQQNCVYSRGSWISSEINDNNFKYYREAISGDIVDEPKVVGGVYMEYGDLEGIQSMGATLSDVTIKYDKTDTEYYNQYIQLFPKSQEQQRREELKQLEDQYQKDLSALSAEMDEALSALEDIEKQKQTIIDSCYKEAYAYAWVHMGEVYLSWTGEDLSSFIDFAKNPPYANAVSGDFNNIKDFEYQKKIFDQLNPYVESHSDLSVYGQDVDSIDKLEQLYKAYILNSDLSSSHIAAITNMCNSVNYQAVDSAYNFIQETYDPELTEELVLQFADRLEGTSPSVGAMWRVFLEQYISDNLETLLDLYYQELFRIQNWMSDIQARSEALTDEYNQNKAEIENKQYNIQLPNFKALNRLYARRTNPLEHTIIDGTGSYSYDRWASVKMGVEDGQSEQEAFYDGCRYRYPYSYDGDPNACCNNNTYLMYNIKTEYKFNWDTQQEKIKPFVYQGYKSYDEFRRYGLIDIDEEVRNQVGYTDKKSWFGDDYTDDELKKYNLSATIKMYLDPDSGGGWSAIVFDKGGEIKVTVIDADTGAVKSEWYAEIIGVNSFSNDQGGIARDELAFSLKYDLPSGFRSYPPMKLKKADSKSIEIMHLPNIMCEAQFKCQKDK